MHRIINILQVTVSSEPTTFDCNKRFAVEAVNVDVPTGTVHKGHVHVGI